MDGFNTPLSNKRKLKASQWITSTFTTTASTNKHTPVSTNRKYTASATSRKYAKRRRNSSESGNNSPSIPFKRTYTSLARSEDQKHKQWYDQHAPINTDELSVHKKKIVEVESWLQNSMNKTSRHSSILVISGPSGCGKTATLKLAAAKFGYSVDEWLNPVTTSFELTKRAGLRYENLVLQFNEFLYRSGKYASVIADNKLNSYLSSQKNKVILIEDLPNFVLRDPSEIKSIFRKYRMMRCSPLVLILSTGDSNEGIFRQLRDPEIKPLFNQIAFNAISSTLLQKALKRVAVMEGVTLSKEEISELVSSANGDVRTAINLLQFNSVGLSNSQKLSKGAKSKLSCGSSKDSTLFLFRALGKIFYCKRDPPTQKKKESNKVIPSSSKNYRDPLVNQPEKVLDQCCLSGSAFSAFLHQNYTGFMEKNPIEDVCMAADSMSQADLLTRGQYLEDSNSPVQTKLDTYEGIIASRGVVFSNSLRATSEKCASCHGNWRPMHKPTCFEVERKFRDNHCLGHNLFWKMGQGCGSAKNLMLDTLPMMSRHFSMTRLLNTQQQMFIRDVATLQVKQSFRSGDFNSKINENENFLEETNTIEKTLDVDVSSDENQYDDDALIEEFSD